MKIEKRSLNNCFIAIIAVTLFVVTALALFLASPNAKNTFASENQVESAETSAENNCEIASNTTQGTAYLSLEKFQHLTKVERDLRDQNPSILPYEMIALLEIELESLNLQSEATAACNSYGYIIPANINNPIRIFGRYITPAQIALLATRPIQFIISYNASLDAIDQGRVFYRYYNHDDNNANAFRHAYWCALMTFRMGPTYAHIFGTAHEPEIGRPASCISTEMDHINNERGIADASNYITRHFNIISGWNYSQSISDVQLANLIKLRVAQGYYVQLACPRYDRRIVPSDWYLLKDEFLYTTSSASGERSITGSIVPLSGNITIPSQINGQAVVSIRQNAFYGQNNLTAVVIPNTITYIGSFSFMGTSLTTINIPASVDRIRQDAFRDVTTLTSVNFANGSVLNRIGNNAFRNTRLVSVSLPNGLTEIGSNTFNDIPTLNSITIPSTVTTIGSNVFSQSARIYIQSGRTTLPTGLLTGTGARHIILPHTVTTAQVNSIPTNATVHFASDVTHIPNSLFSVSRAGGDIGLRHIVIHSGVVNIGTSSFNGGVNSAFSLQSVVFESGSSLTTIGEAAFMNNNHLTSIVIPASVQQINRSAFAGIRLTNVSFGTGSSLTYIGQHAFSQNNFTQIVLPNSLRIIGEEAFQSNPNLTSFTIPASVFSIGNRAWNNTPSLTAINVAAGNQHFRAVSGVLYNFAQTELIRYPQARAGASFAIPNSVTHIASGAFNGTINLTQLNINSTSRVIALGNNAFVGSSVSNVHFQNSMTRDLYVADSAWRAAFPNESAFTSPPPPARPDTVPDDLTARAGQTLGDVVLPVGWSWVNAYEEICIYHWAFCYCCSTFMSLARFQMAGFTTSHHMLTITIISSRSDNFRSASGWIGVYNVGVTHYCRIERLEKMRQQLMQALYCESVGFRYLET